jgi:hypothetical protein
VKRVVAFVCAGALALHLVGGVAALVLLPRGFARGDIHCWSNTVIPLTLSIAVATALIHAAIRRSTLALAELASATAGGWASAVVTGAILFPISMPVGRLAVPAIGAALLLALAWWSKQRLARSLGALAIGAGLGAVVIVAQRAPLPSTHPAGGAVIGDATGDVVAACGSRQIRLEPLLTFTSTTPDRTWTILSRENRARVDHSLAVRHDADVVDVDATSTLPEPVYSHLNSFTAIQIPFDATVSFGPTGVVRFPIEPADYPSGRPIKLAYLDAELAFHVARADDAEKGPFHELATGSLARGDALTLEIRPRDDSDIGCRLTFSDWAAQVSTDPSPTAGWGVPQGSIQFFSRFVLLTLADTGPGRGFDSVGHAAGTYRNRIRIEPNR